ncbi:MAG: hypothetical protein VZR95_01240 [Alphaproteobacteria bacterium]
MMKKFVFIGLLAVLCSCRARTVNQPDPAATYDETGYTAEYTMPEEDLYRYNISVKAMGDDYVVYEYSDVRVDKVATLASAYCFETNPGKKAYLRDIYLHKNHKRRATFDCVDLATE